MSSGISFYNPLFTLLSFIAVLISLWVYPRLKNSCSQAIRAAIVCGCVLSLLASVLPSWAVVLTVAFVPSFVYHMINPLVMAPSVVGIVGFIGGWCLFIMLREFYSLMLVVYQPPRINVTLTAFFIFIGMCYALRGGMADYHLILHAQVISRYAPSGNDANRLEAIYQEVVLSTDPRMFVDVVSLLAQNRNAPPQLLQQIYAKTSALTVDALSRSYIYRTLIKNPNTSSDLFEKLMFSLSQTKSFTKDSVAITLPQDHQFSQNSIAQLMDYPDCEIRRAIISYPNISEDVLDTMSRHDPDVGIRHEAKIRLEFIRGVSHLENNSKTAQSSHPQPLVDTSQITNAVSTAQLHDIYNNMTDDIDAQEVLESMAANCFISDELARKIFAKADTFKNYSRTAVLKALASNPKTPADILNRLAEEKDLAILRELASNPHLTMAAMSKLAPFPDCRVRKKIICSPDLSSGLLKQFRHDHDESVVLEANQRMMGRENYLQTCVETKKLNLSCQKYYSSISSSPDMRIYPNTSRMEPLFRFFRGQELS
jgi:hypothetical protein